MPKNMGARVYEERQRKERERAAGEEAMRVTLEEKKEIRRQKMAGKRVDTQVLHEHIRIIAQHREIPFNRVADEMRIRPNTLSDLKKGCTPSGDSMLRIVSWLRASIDDFEYQE